MSSILTDKHVPVILLVVLVFALGILACNGGTTVGGTAEATIQLPPTQPPTEPTQPPVSEPTAQPPPDTPAPADTPTPSAPPLEVHAGSDYLSFGYLHVVGEVVNNTDEWYEFVEVIGSFFDGGGTMLASGFTYTMLDQVPPHGVAPFDLMSDVGGSATDVASYTLQVEGRATRQAGYGDLAATVTNQYEDFGYYHLVGQVENRGSLDCEFVEVVAALYDADGKVVGVGFTYTQLDTVAAGGSSPFDVMLVEAPPFEQYRVWVEGRPVR